MNTGKIVVLGTGGTIAGTAALPGAGLGYRAAQLGVAQLLAAVPGLEQAAAGAPLHAEQLAQIDSKDMDWPVWRALAQRCAQLQASSAVRAIVITHGTDTLEETAWFLHSVLAAHKPVLLTCAMRPATALAPDGPQNLRDAVAVAASAGVQGVLVVAAGCVHGAQAFTKVHPYRIDAFSSGECGPLAWVEEGALRWNANRPPALIQQAPAAIKKIVNADRLPRVDIVLSHAGADGRIVDALVANASAGIVVAATGNGSLHQALYAALERAQRAGVAVRLVSRCPQGQLLAQEGGPFAHYAGLSAVKARITLQLELLQA